MAEKIIIHMNNKLETVFLFNDPESPDFTVLTTVERIHALTPYGMLLASLGACTGLVIHTYAKNHHLRLLEVRITLEFDRIYQKDSEHYDQISDYHEQIGEYIFFDGDLSQKDIDTLLEVAHQCPIYKMFEQGMQVNLQVSGAGEERDKEIKK